MWELLDMGHITGIASYRSQYGRGPATKEEQEKEDNRSEWNLLDRSSWKSSPSGDAVAAPLGSCDCQPSQWACRSCQHINPSGSKDIQSVSHLDLQRLRAVYARLVILTMTP